MNDKPANRQLALCRKEYIRLAREVRQKGLSQDAIDACQTTLAENRDGQWFLKPTAFLPTGVALGCPLPQMQIQKLFYRATQLIEEWMCCQYEAGTPVFAYVPPQAYHITIVNRSHYEFNAVVPLTSDEKMNIERTIAGLHLGQVSVVTSGVFLTHTGRLFVKCLVLDDAILALRTVLAQTYPQLRTNIPSMVHIKIGHLMKNIDHQELLEFNTWLERLGNHTITRIDFTDLFTPAGRIGL